MNFYETKMGHIFFNHQLPELIKALREIAAALSTPSKLDQNVKRAENALLPVLGQSVRLFEQYQEAVCERDNAIAEQSYCCGYRTAVQMIISGLTALPPQTGGVPDEQ